MPRKGFKQDARGDWWVEMDLSHDPEMFETQICPDTGLFKRSVAPDVMAWMRENDPKAIVHWHLVAPRYEIVFADERAAMAFKLRWC